MSWQRVQQKDVVDRWRALTADEARIVDTVIRDAEDIVQAAADDAGIAEPGSNDQRRLRAYIRVVATMVIRVLKNPDGILTETIDDYTYRRDSAVSAGALYVSDEEIEQLRPTANRRRRGAFTIVPS